MVESIADPIEEGVGREEVILLSELIKLGIPVEHTCRDVLIENPDDQRREDGENDVVVRH